MQRRETQTREAQTEGRADEMGSAGDTRGEKGEGFDPLEVQMREFHTREGYTIERRIHTQAG